MAIYKSAEINLPASAETVFSKLSNLENLRSLLANVPEGSIPADKKEMFDNITITSDSITVPGGPVGALTFKVTEKEAPNYIRLTGEGAPIPMALAMHLSPVDSNSSKAQVDIDIQIPAMLKPMIGGQIQKMADQFGQVLQSIPFS